MLVLDADDSATASSCNSMNSLYNLGVNIKKRFITETVEVKCTPRVEEDVPALSCVLSTTLLVVDGVSIAVDDTEAGRRLVVLVNIPENVHLLEGSTSNLLPVGLSVLDAGNSIAVVGSTDRPTSLSHPHPFSRRNLVNDSTNPVDGAPECVACLIDTAAFEVGVCV